MGPLDWVQLIFTGVAGLFGVFCLFDGSRRLAAHGPNPSGRQLIGVGIAIVMMLAGYSYWKHRMLVEVGRAYQPVELGKELPDDWNRKATPAKREAQSLALARGIFVNTGRIREYFDISGKRVRFIPGPADTKQRETTLARTQQAQQDAQSNFVDFVMWLVWGAFALLLGPLFAREEVPAPAEAEAAPVMTPVPPRPAPPAKPAMPPMPPMPPRPPAQAMPKPASPVPPKSTVGEDTVPLAKPAPAAPPKKT
jgi:hypothetical protein